MKHWLIAALLAVSLSASGCVASMLGGAPGKDLTPEQIKAYSDAQMAVIGCVQVGGPPLAGNTQWVIMPKEYPMHFNFGDNCHIVPTAPAPMILVPNTPGVSVPSFSLAPLK